MGWKKFLLMVVSLLLGSYMLDGIDNIIGAWLFAVAIGMACYHDGKQDGKRETLGGKADNPIR